MFLWVGSECIQGFSKHWTSQRALALTEHWWGGSRRLERQVKCTSALVRSGVILQRIYSAFTSPPRSIARSAHHHQLQECDHRLSFPAWVSLHQMISGSGINIESLYRDRNKPTFPFFFAFLRVILRASARITIALVWVKFGSRLRATYSASWWEGFQKLWTVFPLH